MAKKNPPTKAERERMAKIKEMPCAVCGKHGPSDVHHITECGRRLGHMFTIPLCYEDHRGNRGFSGINRSAWDKSIENQMLLLEQINIKLEQMENCYV